MSRLTIISERADGQVFAVEHDGDYWKAVFPTDLAELSELFEDNDAGFQDACEYVRSQIQEQPL